MKNTAKYMLIAVVLVATVGIVSAVCHHCEDWEDPPIHCIPSPGTCTVITYDETICVLRTGAIGNGTGSDATENYLTSKTETVVKTTFVGTCTYDPEFGVTICYALVEDEGSPENVEVRIPGVQACIN